MAIVEAFLVIEYILAITKVKDFAGDNVPQVPLQLAKQRGRIEITDLLRKHGAKE